MSRFFRYRLRTTDVPAARAFYAAVLRRDDAEIFQLHEQAVARGARPHWLGLLEVADVDAALASFVKRGGTSLGPKWVDPEGLEAAVVRDPGGAVVGLAKPAPGSGGVCGPEVVWHQLSTLDVARAKANYGELLGWELKAPLELGSLGELHPFSWQRGEAVAGAMADIATRPGVHSHWLFNFRVAALEPALEIVRAGGGLALSPLLLPNGDRVAVCDDPQGAAFALLEPHQP